MHFEYFYSTMTSFARNHSSRVRRLALWSAAAGLLATTAANATPVYKCQRLDSEKLSESEAGAINDRNVVVGWAYDGVAKWGKKVDHLLARCPDEIAAVASGINNDGIAVGTVEVAPFPTHKLAVRWSADGSCQVLDRLTADDAFANGINNLGEIAGSLGYSKAGVWSATGVWHALPTPSGTVYPEAMAINDNGTVVGKAFAANGPGILAIRWKDGRAQRLDALPGMSKDVTVPSAINEHGQIVGSSGGNAVTWLTGKVYALPGDGAPGSSAVGVNRAGQIVGLVSYTTPVYWPSYTAAPIAVADLLSDGGCTGPNGEVATVTGLAAINNHGVIAATGEWKDSSGSTVNSAFRLQPVTAQ